MIQGNIYVAFISTINDLVASQSHPGPSDNTIADLYAAVLTNPNEADAELALAIKQSGVPDGTLTSVAKAGVRVTNPNVEANLTMVDAVVSHIKMEATGALPGGFNDLFDFIGHQIILSPSLTKDIAIAATVIDPDQAHFVAHSVAFNNPTAVSNSVASIFAYAQITSPTPYGLPTSPGSSGAFAPGKVFPGVTKGAIIDMPAAAAAITAGLTTGIIEANLSPAATQSALMSTVTNAVTASLAEMGAYLKGPTNPFFQTGVGALPGQFQQSNGTTGGSSPQQTLGYAGAITGYVAEVTVLNQVTISDMTKAVLTAAVGGTAKQYALQIAQAAGQAFAWVAGGGTSPLPSGVRVRRSLTSPLRSSLRPGPILTRLRRYRTRFSLASVKRMWA